MSGCTTHLSVPGPGLTNLDLLAKSVNLGYLDMRGHLLRDASALRNCTRLKTLRLDVSKARVGNILDCLPRLEKLWLTVSEACDLDFSFLATCVRLRDLTLRGVGSTLDISCLASCRQLRKVSLESVSTLLHLDVLASLPHLAKVSLRHTGVENVDALSGCKHLCDIDLAHSAVQDIGGLAACWQLRRVNLCHCPVKDFSPLSACAKLQEFRSTSSELGFLSGCARVRILEVGNARHKYTARLRVLRHCPRLEHLYLDSVQLTDLEFLRFLPKLETLSIYRRINPPHDAPRIKLAPLDLSPLAFCPYLSRLRIENCTVNRGLYPFRHVETIGGLEKLRALTLVGSRVCNLDFLTNCIELERLDMSCSTWLEDIGALRHCLLLRVLRLHCCQFLGHVNGLRHNARLEEFMAFGCSFLANVDELKHCVSLRKLSVRSCGRLTNIADLTPCQQLRNVELSYSGVKDLTPFANCPFLQEIYVDQSAVTDLAPLLGCSRMRVLGVCQYTTYKNLDRLQKARPELLLVKNGR